MGKPMRPMIGPGTVETLPTSAFSRFPIRVEDAWPIVGPLVEMNINRGPLWKVLCAMYLQGMADGAAVEKDRIKGLEAQLDELCPEEKT